MSCDPQGYFVDTAGQEYMAAVTVLDSAVVSPGDTQHLLRYEGDTKPDPRGGMHVNLHNNLWGTAFPQWYGDDGFSRMNIVLSPAKGRAAP